MKSMDNEEERANDLDIIYEKIDQKASYPLILCIGLSIVLWIPAGCFLTSDVILAAEPG